MKLCKKKMAILVTVLCLMVVMVFVLCSFELPNYTTETLYVGQVNYSEAETLYNIVSLQSACGQFNDYTPVLLFFNTYTLEPQLLLVRYGYSFTITNNNGSISLTSQTSNSLFFCSFTDFGYAYFYPTQGTTTALTNVLGIRYSLDSTFDFNPSFSGASGSVVRDSILDVYNYWIDFHQRLQANPNEVESIYNHGYTNGYLTGNLDGYRNGYDEGIDYGYNVGYPEGYDSGLNDGYYIGYDTGYSSGFANGYYQGDIDGYESGYEEGYSEGYEEAERETVTVIEYVEPVEISIGSVISGISSVPDNILNGTFDFELFGINVYGLLKVIIILFVISAVVVFVIKRSA